MTRQQWKQLPEAEREAIRQASAVQSQPGYDLPKEVWIAQDAYRVGSAAWGVILLPFAVFVVVWVSGFLNLLLRTLRLSHWLGLVVVLALLSGCMPLYDLNLEMARWSGIDCRPEKLVDGRCVRVVAKEK